MAGYITGKMLLDLIEVQVINGYQNKVSISHCFADNIKTTKFIFKKLVYTWLYDAHGEMQRCIIAVRAIVESEAMYCRK